MLKSFFKGNGGFPAEFGFEFTRVNGVAFVVAGTIGNVGNELFGAAGGAPKFAVEEAAKEPDQLNVGPFVEAANVVRLAEVPVVENGIDGAGVVFYPQPISNVVAFAVDGQGLFIDDVVDHQWNEFFWEMMRAIVIRAIAHLDGQAVGVEIGAHKMIRRRFGGRIGAARVIGG